METLGDALLVVVFAGPTFMLAFSRWKQWKQEQRHQQAPSILTPPTAPSVDGEARLAHDSSGQLNKAA